MKKSLILLLSVILLLVFSAAGTAEETVTRSGPDVFNLYEVKEEGARWLGTAIPVADGAVLTSCTCLPEDISTLVITDGSAAWDPLACLSDATGTAAVLLYGGEDQSTPVVGSFQLADDAVAFSSGANYVLVGDELGSRIYRNIYSAAAIQWRGEKCLLLSLSGPAQPGSPVISEKGDLSGIVVAEYAEGPNRVVVFPAAEIRRCLAEASQQLDGFTAGLQDNRPEGFKITLDRNKATFNWHAMTMPQPAAGESLYLVLADTQNTYFTYFEISKERDYETVILVPGRTYVSGIVAAKGAPEGIPEQYAVTVLPEAEKLTEHEFQSEICALVKREVNPVPLTEVTEGMMRSGNLRFYSCSRYQVEKGIENLSLLVCLKDPNGEIYTYLSSWYYDPSCMDHDAWSVPLADTGLLEMLNAKGYPKGTYELSMYIWGELADSSTFELK